MEISFNVLNGNNKLISSFLLLCLFTYGTKSELNYGQSSKCLWWILNNFQGREIKAQKTTCKNIESLTNIWLWEEKVANSVVKKVFRKHYEFLIIKIVFDAVCRENNQHEQFITKQLIFWGKKYIHNWKINREIFVQ